MTDVRQDPAYSDGFENAKAGEPLFDSASAAYAAGWRAYWSLRAQWDEWREHNNEHRISELP